MCRDIPEDQCREQPQNFVLQCLAQVFSKIGDALADTKIVLPWLLGAVGAPVFLVGFLVPIRDSLALLPQILVGGVIRRFAVRKGFWVAGSIVEGACITLMAVTAAAGFSGVVAGWTIIGLLVVFSVARGVASIAAKDTLGKTVSKGRRGRVSGYAATLSGLVAGGIGLYLVVTPEAARPDWMLYAMIAAAGGSWFIAAAVFALTKEFPGATDGGRGIHDIARDQFKLLIENRALQKFLIARTFLISTALAGPVYVSLAQRTSGQTLDNLGWLIVASGLASAVSASVWGKLSDRSSRLTMALAATVAGALGLAVLATMVFVPELSRHIGFYAVILFVLAIAHAGVRIGRKTHIVDLAPGDQKAEYVALSNTIIGVLLLLLGALVAALLAISFEAVIAVLSTFALLGAATAFFMEDVQT
ncbi:MAG: MFS transporter [Alphaproteobacteria bacterium]|nr:MFS transporter [Alphaproteobacteria bacterium]